MPAEWNKALPMFAEIKSKFANWTRGLSFRTGVIVLSLCVPCYLLAFAPLAFDISVASKGILWVVFFGLAKTFQYGGIAILGAEGIRKLKKWRTRAR